MFLAKAMQRVQSEHSRLRSSFFESSTSSAGSAMYPLILTFHWPVGSGGTCDFTKEHHTHQQTHSKRGTDQSEKTKRSNFGLKLEISSRGDNKLRERDGG